MSTRTLFVLRMPPENAEHVATLFAEHDKGDLPHVVGLTRRTLFEFNGLYMHLVEGTEDSMRRLAANRDRPDFQEINTRLDDYLQRYDPANWRDLTDSMARPFYTWTAE